MAKSNKNIALDNLKGFVRQGASTNSPGNIPTGHFELDFVIHHGENPSNVDIDNLEGYDPGATLGLPLGKIVEIFGEEGSGKSSLAYRVCGYAQKMGHKCAWIDTENSFAENLARINGCEPEDLYYSDLTSEDNPDVVYTAEAVFDMIIELCKTNAKGKDGIKVIVLDSVASLVPKAEEEATADKANVATLARLMSSQLKKIGNYAAKYGVLLIFINQIREKIGVMFGNPETTPGGRALRFQSSLRIRIRKKGGKDADIMVANSNGGERRIGRLVGVRLEKNRFAKPHVDTMIIPMYYEEYFPELEEIAFNLGRQLKLIRVRKGVFSWSDMKVEGKEDFIDHLKYNKRTDELIADLVETAKEAHVILPPELSQKAAKLKKAKADGDSKKTSVRASRKGKDSTSSGEDSKK